MKTSQAARILFAIAISVIFSNCSSYHGSFFRYNSPFEGQKLVGYDNLIKQDRGEVYSDLENLPGSSLADVTREPGVPNLYVNNELTEEELALINNPDSTTIDPETSPAPDIHVHKRGAAGSVCYTCRGKGYVLQPTSHFIGDKHKCPACGGDGRY